MAPYATCSSDEPKAKEHHWLKAFVLLYEMVACAYKRSSVNGLLIMLLHVFEKEEKPMFANGFQRYSCSQILSPD
nr:AlNc14C46G3714 [Albugo laibachii Nc14]|eukprot:CCA18161.1 AlNc14C46G3714 [Albugo laibachii Nc14]